jgi:hypothetical protein
MSVIQYRAACHKTEHIHSVGYTNLMISMMLTSQQSCISTWRHKRWEAWSVIFREKHRLRGIKKE